jgi:geranylgeranyl pyrophosphate synthase
MQPSIGLVGFLERLDAHVDASIQAGGFDVRQRELLQQTAARYRPRSRRNPLGDPLAIFYLVARAHRDELDAQGLELAGFCQFYLLALDLLDDVQDEDLAGKPHQRVGAAMAINDGLTLLFLGLSSLERCMRLERSPSRRMQYLKLVNRVALSTGRGQHLDLLGAEGARTPREVLQMQREKTASLTLICECAALYGGLTDDEREHYRVVGENLSLLVQVLDDVRDVYGKSRSPDLETGKLTYPLSCFLERADPLDRARFAELKSKLPASLREIRGLLYRTGALQEVAASMDRFRRAIHVEVAALEHEAGQLRLLLSIIDQLVEGVYTPQPVAETASLRLPRHGFCGHVQRLARDFSARLAPFGAPPPPPLLPWHLPHWMYDKARGVIFHPDIEGLPDETLPFQSALLGERDLDLVARLVWQQAPAVVAHELFHHYRDHVGKLGEDMWHEELVANTLAMAYTSRYEPAAVRGGLQLAERVLSRPEHALTPEARRTLDALLSPGRPEQAAGYGLDMHQTALVQLAMIRALAEKELDLEVEIRRWLPGRYANAS